MEIPLSLCQSMSLSDHKEDNQKSLLFKYCFSFSKRNPFRKIWCSLDQVPKLRQKPWPKPQQSKINTSEQKQLKKPSLVLCSQIEKLVLCGRYREAFDLFEILEITGGFDVGSSTYDALVTACIGLKYVKGVERVVSYMNGNDFEPDQYMFNRLLLMQVRCGMFTQAREFFASMPERNLASWDTIITALMDSESYSEGFQLFLIAWEEIFDIGSRIISTMIRLSARLGILSTGQQFHCCALKMGAKDDVFVSCALINMYSKCGSIEDGHSVFDTMQEKTVVGFNSLIAGYVLNGYSEEALNVCYSMRDAGVKMDHFTFSTILSVFTRLGSVEHAKQAHAGLLRHGFGSDIEANTALVDFYGKWSTIEYARSVFEQMPYKNVSSWNALIFGYGHHGRGAEAVEVFKQMNHEKVKPNHVTFLAVLSACSGSGLSEYGFDLFESMNSTYNCIPRAMHYECMIELLGRDGRLEEAFECLTNAPLEPKPNMWAALLTASRLHGNLELGKLAAENLYGMEPEKLNNYIVLLNLYNSSGELKEANAVLQTLKRKGLIMRPACSWIDVNYQPHCFLSGDKQHVQTLEIYQKVDELMLEMPKYGTTVEERNLLPDVDEQEARLLMYHSEKLAIAFGLINTPYWTPLQVVQGHRICGECHNTIKLITKVTGRVIVVRDASRFHHFKNGACSCGDYW